jgi:hypothetical protein
LRAGFGIEWPVLKVDTSKRDIFMVRQPNI